MPDYKPEPVPFSVTLEDGTRLQLKCPICGHDKFATAGPPRSEAGHGFQHVIVGQIVPASGEKKSLGTLSLPIRFQFCANCGYILKFMIHKRESNEEGEP
jgi:hypothetical protein